MVLEWGISVCLMEEHKYKSVGIVEISDIFVTDDDFSYWTEPNDRAYPMVLLQVFHSVFGLVKFQSCNSL